MDDRRRRRIAHDHRRSVARLSRRRLLESVGTKLDRFTAYSDGRIGLSGAVDNQLGINIEPERFDLWRFAEGAGDKVSFARPLFTKLNGGDLSLDVAPN